MRTFYFEVSIKVHLSTVARVAVEAADAFEAREAVALFTSETWAGQTPEEVSADINHALDAWGDDALTVGAPLPVGEIAAVDLDRLLDAEEVARLLELEAHRDAEAAGQARLFGGGL